MIGTTLSHSRITTKPASFWDSPCAVLSSVLESALGSIQYVT
jgi:hypothetical protein